MVLSSMYQFCFGANLADICSFYVLSLVLSIRMLLNVVKQSVLMLCFLIRF